MFLAIFHKYCIQLSALRNKGTMGPLSTVQVISEIIKRIKSSFGEERDEIRTSKETETEILITHKHDINK